MKQNRCCDCKKRTDAGPCQGCGLIVCQLCAEREGEFCNCEDDPPAPSEKPSEDHTYPPCPTCGEEIDPVFGRCRQPSHPPPPESGTLRGDYERMAREWWGTYPRTAKNLAALLARVADEERARIVAWLEMRDGVMYLDCSCYRNAAEEVANREYER